VPVARAARGDPVAWLAMDDIYGRTGQAEPFRVGFARALEALWAQGTAAVSTRYLDDEL
jgi:mannitol 2-dehydrogenase